MIHKTSLCFTPAGLITPPATSTDTIQNLVLFGDGSAEAIDRMRDPEIQTLVDSLDAKHLYICRTPLYEMRVRHQDNQVSQPHYVFTEADRIRWFCAKVAAPHFEILLSTANSKTTTQVKLDKENTEAICYIAYNLWQLIEQVSDRLCFPALALERMMLSTFYLHPQRMNIEALREATGLSALEYHHATETLQICVGEEVFTVKISLLNDLYGDLILPYFRKFRGHRVGLEVAVASMGSHTLKAGMQSFSEPLAMSLGELGSIISAMEIYASYRKIEAESPLEPGDLKAFAKHVRIDSESCFTVEEGETIADALDRLSPLLVRANANDDTERDFGSAAPDTRTVA